jgi:nitrogen regulatory protein P-II 1
MQVFILVLNKTDYLEDILRGFMDAGITGATILDSVGMGRALLNDDSVDLPIVASLRTMFMGSRPHNNTIFTVVDDNMVDKAFEVVESILGDMSKPGVGLAFALPVGRAAGVKSK